LIFIIKNENDKVWNIKIKDRKRVT
jgi:hypothetical protein